MQAQYRELVASRDMLIDAVRRVAPRADLTGDPNAVCPVTPPSSSPASPGKRCSSTWTRAASLPHPARLRHRAPRDSATLLAMGLEPSIAKSALRMTFRKPLTREQVERISLAIEESYTDLTRH